MCFSSVVGSEASRIGILPGWHGMENGQKPEMEKKWKSKWKTAPSWTGAKNGQKMDFGGSSPCSFLKNPFFGPFFAPVQLGPFSISISIFSISGF